jgi:hypothetical protein
VAFIRQLLNRILTEPACPDTTTDHHTLYDIEARNLRL